MVLFDYMWKQCELYLAKIFTAIFISFNQDNRERWTHEGIIIALYKFQEPICT